MRREVREQENKREERERGGDACDICFQKAILPTLLASNRTLVSSVKSCQSSNRQQTVLFTELFLKKFVCMRKKIFLPLKMKELASNTCSTFSAGDIHSADDMPAAVGFFCYY